MTSHYLTQAELDARRADVAEPEGYDEHLEQIEARLADEAAKR